MHCTRTSMFHAHQTKVPTRVHQRFRRVSPPPVYPSGRRHFHLLRKPGAVQLFASSLLCLNDSGCVTWYTWTSDVVKFFVVTDSSASSSAQAFLPSQIRPCEAKPSSMRHRRFTCSLSTSGSPPTPPPPPPPPLMCFHFLMIVLAGLGRSRRTCAC
jgi:hypothetical protein